MIGTIDLAAGWLALFGVGMIIDAESKRKEKQRLAAASQHKPLVRLPDGPIIEKTMFGFVYKKQVVGHDGCSLMSGNYRFSVN